MSFWLIDEKWRLYTAGRCRKQGTAAIAHGSEVRLTPRPFGMNSAAFDSYTKPMKTEIESRNARHTSRFGLGRNRSSLFPQAAPWFVNLDSVPCASAPREPQMKGRNPNRNVDADLRAD